MSITGLSRMTLWRARRAGRLADREQEGRVFVEGDELARYLAQAKPRVLGSRVKRRARRGSTEPRGGEPRTGL